MTIEWKPRKARPWGFEAELNSLELIVFFADTEEDGPHVVWVVRRVNSESNVAEGIVVCWATPEQVSQIPFPLALQSAYDLAKKEAEDSFPGRNE